MISKAFTELLSASCHLVLLGKSALACNVDCQHHVALVLLHLSVPAIYILQRHGGVCQQTYIPSDKKRNWMQACIDIGANRAAVTELIAP